MADRVLEGDTVYDASGNEFRMGADGTPVPAAQYKPSAEGGPSRWEDVKSGSLPWLARGVEDTVGSFGALGDLAGRGEEWVGNKLQGAGATNLARPFLEEGKNLQNISSYATPETIAGKVDPYVQAAGFDPNYQPKTEVGRYVRTGENFLPGAVAAGMLGPESMALSLLRGAGGAAGSETLGHAADSFTGEGSTTGAIARLLGGGIGSAFAPRAVTPFPTTSPLRTEAAKATQEAIGPHGGYVNAAQKTGSPRLQSILGEPQDNSGAITQAMMERGGVPWKPGQKFGPTLDAAENRWRSAFDQATQTPVTRDPPMWQQVQDLRNKAHADLTPGIHDDAIAEVDKAYEAFRQKPTGNAAPSQITGDRFLNLRDTLLDSKNQYVKKMGQALDAAGRRSTPAWDDLSTRWADLKGLRAGAEEAGDLGESLKPGTVAGGMRKDTPMRQLAQNADKAFEPVKAAKPTGLGELIPAAVGSIAGYKAGLPGLDPTWGLLLGGAAGSAAKRALSPLVTNKLSQSLLGNQLTTAGNRLTPKQAALLLQSPVSGVQKSLTGPE